MKCPRVPPTEQTSGALTETCGNLWHGAPKIICFLHPTRYSNIQSVRCDATYLSKVGFGEGPYIPLVLGRTVFGLFGRFRRRFEVWLWVIHKFSLIWLKFIGKFRSSTQIARWYSQCGCLIFIISRKKVKKIVRFHRFLRGQWSSQVLGRDQRWWWYYGTKCIVKMSPRYLLLASHRYIFI